MSTSPGSRSAVPPPCRRSAKLLLLVQLHGGSAHRIADVDVCRSVDQAQRFFGGYGGQPPGNPDGGKYSDIGHWSVGLDVNNLVWRGRGRMDAGSDIRHQQKLADFLAGEFQRQ